MITNPITRGIENTVDSSGGLVWNRLHSEREAICAALVKESAHSLKEAHAVHSSPELLQARLRKIDDALDRLFSGSYGHCSKCRKRIEDMKLNIDPATPFCMDCSNLVEGKNSPSSTGTNDEMLEGIALDTLKPFDTVWVSTHHSDYRFFMLDPHRGRVLVEGGRCFVEPVEAMIGGSSSDDSILNNEWIGVGMRIEMWFDDKLIITSGVRSIRVERHSPGLELGLASQTCA